MGEPADPVRLSVPAEPAFAAVLQVAARAVAIRSGLREDARTRLQAAIETAFMAVTDGSPADTQVVALLAGGAGSLELTLLVDPRADPLPAARLADLAVDHDLSGDGRALRMMVGG